MRTGRGIAILLLLALGGCDRLGFGPAAQDGNAQAGNSAGTDSARAGEARPQRAVADAGITRSRSLAGLTGGAPAGGGKEPAVIEANATGTVSPELLVGRWSDDGSCKDQFEFFSDGTFLSASGVEGSWSLDAATLTLVGPGDTVSARLGSAGPDRLLIVNADGSTAQSIRC